MHDFECLGLGVERSNKGEPLRGDTSTTAPRQTDPRYAVLLVWGIALGTGCADDASSYLAATAPEPSEGEQVNAASPDDAPPAAQRVTLAFDARVGDEPAACDREYAALGSGATPARLADARLFLTDIEVRNASGEWVALALDQDTPWQAHNVALLDFEDGSEACAGSGDASLNHEVVGTLPEGTYTGLRFQVGIPTNLNHNDSAVAPAPLNVAPMFWNWRGGYKYLRVDWDISLSGTVDFNAEDAPAVPRWNVHLGASQCVGAAPTSPPEAPCGFANRPAIALPEFVADSHKVVIDLGALVAGADLSANVEGTPPGCMSARTESADCVPVYSNLGLSFETGLCADECDGQRVFSTAPLAETHDPL